jgi:RNA recognition motif-containing protein
LTPEDATRAIDQLNGYEIENKRVKVAYARPAGENRKNNNLYVAHLPHNYSESGKT